MTRPLVKLVMLNSVIFHADALATSDWPMSTKQSHSARDRYPSDETKGSARKDQKRQNGTAG